MTRDAIRGVYDAGPYAVVVPVEGLLTHIADLEVRVQALEDRLTQDSHKSGEPPSSDGGQKKTQTLGKALRRFQDECAQPGLH